MQLLPPILARKLMPSLSLVLLGCANFPNISEDSVFAMEQIDFENSTIEGKSISGLEGTEVELSGFVQPQKRGTPELFAMYVKTPDERAKLSCINLVIAPALKSKVWSNRQIKRVFRGEFFTLPRITEATMFFKRDGIDFTASCQYFRDFKSYPYFFVRQIVE